MNLELQNKIFTDLGINCQDGLKLFDNIYAKELNKFVKPTSHHQILFGSISIKNVVKKILETGTYDGQNCKFLSTIFPKSQITTIDLEDEDPLFKISYNRNAVKDKNRFINHRNEILRSCSNIKFIQKHSINFLHSINEKYDLIWIDGAHGYPVVAIDISNSLRLLENTGCLLCDDVYKDLKKKSDSLYHSVASIQTLVSFVQSRSILRFNLIFKRLEDNNKFIALVKENNINK